MLRKGAIESYYSSVSNTTDSGKTSAAATEVESLYEKTDLEIEIQYADMIRVLLFTALDKAVDESFAAKEELLTELALALGVLNTVSNENELLSRISKLREAQNLSSNIE